jgi:hypothetical protein
MEDVDPLSLFFFGGEPTQKNEESTEKPIGRRSTGFDSGVGYGILFHTQGIGYKYPIYIYIYIYIHTHTHTHTHTVLL